jgi:GTPase involved in cell partitioning and DNA repair
MSGSLLRRNWEISSGPAGGRGGRGGEGGKP